MLPNREAFWAFLNSGITRQTGVTNVTGVTSNTINDLRRHTLGKGGVTGVTAVVESGQECPDLDERRAIAQVEGGVPALYAQAFAALQLTPPSGLPVPRWLQAVDDAGRLLDVFGRTAEALGWSASDLLSPTGLVRALNGTPVLVLTSDTAQLADGCIFTKPGSGTHARRLCHG